MKVYSLSGLLSMSDSPVHFVAQPDRRQVVDRRSVWRGGRRLSDHYPVLEEEGGADPLEQAVTFGSHASPAIGS